MKYIQEDRKIGSINSSMQYQNRQCQLFPRYDVSTVSSSLLCNLDLTSVINVPITTTCSLSTKLGDSWKSISSNTRQKLPAEFKVYLELYNAAPNVSTDSVLHHLLQFCKESALAAFCLTARTAYFQNYSKTATFLECSLASCVSETNSASRRDIFL